MYVWLDLPLSLTVSLLIGGWTVRIVMLVVVLRSKRKSPAAAAWLLVIFSLPWLGLVLYLLIGNNRLPKRRIERHARLMSDFRFVTSRMDLARLAPHNMDGDQLRMGALTEQLSAMPILGGNTVEMITDSGHAIDRLVDDIDRAERHVHLMFYIFADDATGRRVADALARAVGRGVDCRVLADDVGSHQMLKTLAPDMRRAGVAVHAVLPVNILRMYMYRFDLRNHRKLVIIDGRIAYTGSQNIIDPGYGRKDGLAWVDILARITGPAVLELQSVFLAEWYYETDTLLENGDLLPAPVQTGSIPIQVVPSGPTFPWRNYQMLVVSAIHHARDRITVTTPYFVPDPVFLEALQIAPLRGVKVEFVFPRHSDQIMVAYASRDYYDELMEAGVNLFLYREGLLHTKSMVIDDSLVFFGTSNYDIRSFDLNFELNLVLYGSEIARQFRDIQAVYMRDAEPLTLESWRSRPFRRKVLESVSRLFSPLL